MSDTRFILAGVMGWPVAHTRSPAIHNHWINSLGLKGAYVQLPVHPDRLAMVIEQDAFRAADNVYGGD